MTEPLDPAQIHLLDQAQAATEEAHELTHMVGSVMDMEKNNTLDDEMVKRVFSRAVHGVKQTCGHVGPGTGMQMVFIRWDQRTASCRECLPRLIAMESDNNCERCGKPADEFSENMVQLGPVLLFFHACRSCSDAMAAGEDPIL